VSTENLTIAAGAVTVSPATLTLRTVSETWAVTKGATLTFSEGDNSFRFHLPGHLVLTSETGVADTLDTISGTGQGLTFTVGVGWSLFR
jgi:hypothetical protein